MRGRVGWMCLEELWGGGGVYIKASAFRAVEDPQRKG